MYVNRLGVPKQVVRLKRVKPKISLIMAKDLNEKYNLLSMP